IKKANDPLLPFRKLDDLLAGVDFNFGNLESPFSGSDKFNPSPTLVFNAPRANVLGLREYNFKVVSLANNHALDQGLKGLKYTKDYLAKNNVQVIGVGSGLEEAWRPGIVASGGLKIGFIAASYASLNDNGKKSNNYVARIEDVTRLRKSVADLKAVVDYVVVAMHAGTEYTHKPNQAQQSFARAAVEAGADMVIGHHPHWVQQIEQYQGKYIFYSLGNFIFDQEWSRQTKEGLVLKISLTRVGELESPALNTRVDLVPVVIENFSTPRLANEAESKKILGSMGLQSSLISY
ncbi:MAG: CapA family protein, partial [Candidatus Kerfeldbacteria bacterium]|nr:CapA family protein [Candidatus Kerfeldbacteria bacterium]